MTGFLEPCGTTPGGGGGTGTPAQHKCAQGWCVKPPILISTHQHSPNGRGGGGGTNDPSWFSTGGKGGGAGMPLGAPPSALIASRVRVMASGF